MQQIDTQTFYTFLYYGEFDQAQKLVTHLNLGELWQVMIAINHDAPTVTSYGYVISLLIHEETAEYHYLASRILIELLYKMEGSYASGFWHAKRAMELYPENISYKEQLLKFYGLPGQLLEKEEAIVLAREVLAIDPKNQYVLNIYTIIGHS